MERIHIYEVVHVELTRAETEPPALIIVAEGRARSSGYGHPALEPRTYPGPPEDGIQEFDFTAEAPTGIVLPALMPITATYEWLGRPAWVHGVRIHAATNAQVAVL